jgi:hypothetical protein
LRADSISCPLIALDSLATLSLTVILAKIDLPVALTVL